MIIELDLKYTNNRLLALYAMGFLVHNTFNIRHYEKLYYFWYISSPSPTAFL